MSDALAPVTKSLDQRRRAFGFSILWSVAVFGLLSALLWGIRFGAWYAVAVSFIAPPFAAVDFTRHADVDMAVVSWSVSALAGVFIVVGWLRPRRALTWLTHCALAVYWFWSFALIGIGA